MRRYIIVFVDDSPRHLDAVRVQLGTLTSRVELVLLSTASSALRYVPNHVVDLVVLDANVPYGIEVCRQLRSANVMASIALVDHRITAAFEMDAYNAGASHVLTKPLDLRTLARVVFR